MAGAMQRRVWTESNNGIIYPNLYVLLVAPPGIGKSQAIARASELWHATKNLHVAPNSVTRAALIDTLAEASVKSILPSGNFQLFHGLNVAASEFGVLCPAHDLEFLNTLNDLFDCHPSFSEARRHRQKGDKELKIAYPILNIVGGTQPGFLSELLPEQAWSMGFTSRLIMVYSSQQIQIELFTSVKPNYDAYQRKLEKDLTTVSQLYGAVSWSREAAEQLTAWYRNGLPPVPLHSRLQHYNTRRLLNIFKLAMVSSVSRSNDLSVLPEDLARAQDWLLTAEEKMPDIFRDMAGKSDKQVIDDLYDFMWRLHMRDNKSIHESRIMSFLSSRVPADKVYRIMELCERSGLIERDKTTSASWKPTAKDNIPGVE